MSGLIRNSISLLIYFICVSTQTSSAAPPKKEFYQIRIYTMKSNDQLLSIDNYLKDAFLPALHRAGIKKIGVFKPVSNDTAAVKSVYVFIPFDSEKTFFKLDKKLRKDATYMTASKSFREASSANPPFDRMESMLLEAFENQKNFIAK